MPPAKAARASAVTPVAAPGSTAGVQVLQSVLLNNRPSSVTSTAVRPFVASVRGASLLSHAVAFQDRPSCDVQIRFVPMKSWVTAAKPVAHAEPAQIMIGCWTVQASSPKTSGGRAVHDRPSRESQAVGGSDPSGWAKAR